MRILSTLLLALVAAASTGAAQTVADSGSFIVRLGNDTIAIERYRHTPLLLTGEALLRTPITRHLKLTATLRTDGSTAWYEVVNSPVAGTGDKTPVTRLLVTFMGDSAQVEMWSGGEPRPTRKVALNGAQLPLQTPFYSTYEIAVQRAKKKRADNLTLLAGATPITYALRFAGADSVFLDHDQAGRNLIVLDRQGRMQRFDGSGSTFKVVVTRSAPVDLTPFLTRFAQADAEGKSIGLLSPPAVLDTHVGETNLMINYGRPAKRGRTIFGNVVPWDQVWRTGANAATQLTVEGKDLMIGDARVRPGIYTLWTIPGRNGWKLIINKQHGQWGTMYDPAQDLARVDVQAETIAVPEELFTIAIEPAGERAATLTLTWDRTRVKVPLREFDPLGK